ncbi:MAG: tyrosine phenol-lyase [Armatimonadetes bacterium]|nr:tyrosine phenol-lyase [Armatimonadota bacterium]
MRIIDNIPNSWCEPWKIKTIEHISLSTREEREAALEAAGWNTFLLPSRLVFIDLLTDSGTNAMSDEQWAAIMTGDEAYAGSKDFERLEAVVQEVYGYKHLIPTHQGRGAEHILSQTLIRKGQYVPGNMYFTTTKFHQEYAGGIFEDVIVDEAFDPNLEFPFKGNIDIDKLDALVKRVGPEQIAYVSLETNVNMCGGQPISMANARALHEYCSKRGILVMLDATRAVENCYFIKTREPGYADKSIADILHELCGYTDGCTISGKKDCLVNIGGFLALRDDKLALRARELLVAFEGLQTYGGMAGRDMGAMAVGILESLHYDYIRARVEQVAYLGKRLDSFGVPIVRPYGGHAIYLNAKQILPHVPQEKYPAQRIAGELYLEAGVRSMERGIVSAGRDHDGNEYKPALELVRLTLPRRVYTQSHLDVVSEACARVCKRADSINGLKMVHEPGSLRFFQARFEPLGVPAPGAKKAMAAASR